MTSLSWRQSLTLRLALIEYDAQARLTPTIKKEIAGGCSETLATFRAIWALRGNAENN